MITVTLARPWLTVHLPRSMRVLSWAPHGAGYTTTALILWREVRNADLGLGFDAESWLAAQMPDPGAVGMLTSRDVSSFRQGVARVEGITAACVVTAGLSNAESIGHRLPWHPADESGGPGYGTINIAVATDAPLTPTAQLEALSIVAEARTAAVIAAGLDLPTGRATGTGTDCIALACDPGEGRYAGLHTPAGEALGRAVHDTMAQALADWLAWRAAKRAHPS